MKIKFVVEFSQTRHELRIRTPDTANTSRGYYARALHEGRSQE
jgi:hypothetical protein